MDYFSAEETKRLTDKEQWIQQCAVLIVESRGFDVDTALAASRWASIWMDEFNTRLSETLPVVKDVLVRILRESKQEALNKCESVPRYPTGVPTLKAIIASEDAFCMGFGEEAEAIRGLLSTQHD